MNKTFMGYHLSLSMLNHDDVLVHSATANQHRDHLQVFQRVREAGLTLKGKNCHITMSALHYLRARLLRSQDVTRYTDNQESAYSQLQ